MYINLVWCTKPSTDTKPIPDEKIDRIERWFEFNTESSVTIWYLSYLLSPTQIDYYRSYNTRNPSIQFVDILSIHSYYPSLFYYIFLKQLKQVRFDMGVIIDFIKVAAGYAFHSIEPFLYIQLDFDYLPQAISPVIAAYGRPLLFMTAATNWARRNSSYENSLFCSDTSDWFRPIMNALFESYVKYLYMNESCYADPMTLECYIHPIVAIVKQKYKDVVTGKDTNNYQDQVTGKNKHCIQQLTSYDPEKTLFKLQNQLARTWVSKNYDEETLKLLHQMIKKF